MIFLKRGDNAVCLPRADSQGNWKVYFYFEPNTNTYFKATNFKQIRLKLFFETFSFS